MIYQYSFESNVNPEPKYHMHVFYIYELIKGVSNLISTVKIFIVYVQ